MSGVAEGWVSVLGSGFEAPRGPRPPLAPSPAITRPGRSQAPIQPLAPVLCSAPSAHCFASLPSPEHHTQASGTPS